MNSSKPHSLAPPAPTLLERAQAAMIRAAWLAMVLSLLAVAYAWLVGAVDWFAGRGDFPNFVSLLPTAGLLATALFMVLVPVAFVLSTRTMQNRAFTGAGFVATFFGLAMLVVLFSQLSRDAVDWFRQTPRLVERQNARLLVAAEAAKAELDSAIADRDAELAKIDTDRTMTAAEKQAEKQEIHKLLDPDVAGHRKTLEELERNKTRDLRTDTSPGALFWFFMTNGAAPVDRPQDAGIWFALLGSLWMGLITLLFAVPVGVGAAIYLEEYRTSSRLSRLIQLNINNLAGVPSVVYGILGAFVFVGLIFRPLHQQFDAIADRNVLGGGLTLGLLTLPVVIVAAQEAIRAVPSSIRHGAYALGATRWQTIWRTVLPMSLPGILTGTILSLSRAIGEAAPLLLFGAIMYVAEEPSPFSRFTILPMTIFGWARRPPTELANGEVVEAWRNNAAMASVILLVALLTLNALAIYLRNRTQKRSRY